MTKVRKLRKQSATFAGDSKGKKLGFSLNILYIQISNKSLFIWHIQQSNPSVDVNGAYMFQHVTFSFEQIGTVGTLERWHFTTFPFPVECETCLVLIWWAAMARERFAWSVFHKFLVRLVSVKTEQLTAIVWKKINKTENWEN